MGCWTPVETFGLDDAAAVGGKPFDWSARLVEADGSVFAVLHAGSEIGTVRWPLLGRHNLMNALSALAACRAVGVDVAAVIPEIGRAHVRTPVTNAHIVCRLMLEKKKR